MTVKTREKKKSTYMVENVPYLTPVQCWHVAVSNVKVWSHFQIKAGRGVVIGPCRWVTYPFRFRSSLGTIIGLSRRSLGFQKPKQIVSWLKCWVQTLMMRLSLGCIIGLSWLLCSINDRLVLDEFTSAVWMFDECIHMHVYIKLCLYIYVYLI